MKVIPNIKEKWQASTKHQKKWFGQWHLILGGFAGFIIAIVGLSGSILVFREEIDRALNPALFKVLEQQHRLSFAEIIPAVKKNHPELDVQYIYMEGDELTNPYRVFDRVKREEIFINPYTGKISGRRLYESYLIGFITDFHRTLLIPAAGRYIVGTSALILLILTISGLRLWLPKKWSQLKANLRIDFSANFKRKNYDWHRVLGLYSSPVIVVLSVTGFCITFSQVVIPLLFLLNFKSPQNVGQLLGAKSAYSKGIPPLSLEEILSVAARTMPEGKVRGLALPADSLGSYRLDILSKGISHAGEREMLVIDQYNGKVYLNSRRDFPNAGKAYLSWLTPLHYGSFGGLPTQILALLGSLIPAALFVTGFIIWYPRAKKQRDKLAGKKKK